MFQVQAAVAITQISSKPVLLTVPCSVIASPSPTPSPWNALAFRAGFDVLIKSATVTLLCAARADVVARPELRPPPLFPTYYGNFTSFRVSAGAPEVARGWPQTKNPWASGLPAQGSVWIQVLGLVRINDGNCFVHMMMGTVNVHDHAVSQASRFRVILFLFDIVMRLVQQRAGLVQASGPRIVRVHGNVISNVLAVIVCRLLDFSDGMVDLFDRGALLSVQNAAVGALQVRPGIAQIGKGVQVSWMLALRAENLRREREQECNRRGDHSNSGKSFHSDYHLVWNWDGFRGGWDRGLALQSSKTRGGGFCCGLAENCFHKGNARRWTAMGLMPGVFVDVRDCGEHEGRRITT